MCIGQPALRSYLYLPRYLVQSDISLFPAVTLITQKVVGNCICQVTIRPSNISPYIITPRLKTISLKTNRSYDQNFLKKISIQTSINLIKISFRNTFLYFVEATLILLFCKRMITYLNPSSTCWRM